MATTLRTLLTLGGTAMLGLVISGLTPSGLDAQSISTGAVAGHVQSEAGQLLSGVRVELRPVTGGVPRVADTGMGGVFAFPLVEPGEYEILLERLGYRPVVLAPLPVRMARRLDLEVVLSEAWETVVAPDSVAFRGAAVAGGSLPGRSRRFGEWELESLPQRHGDLGELARYTSQPDQPLQVEGLPSGLMGLTVEGVPYRPARHGAGTGAMLEGLLLPSRASGGMELLAGRPDAEWPGTAGALMATVLPTIGGAAGEVGGHWGGGALGIDETVPPGFQDWRVGGSAGASMVQDSARLWVFGEAQGRDRTALYWSDRAGSVDAFAEAGLDVSSINAYGRGTSNRINGGGSFDWRFAGGRRIDVIALFGQGDQDHIQSAYSGQDFPATIEGQDLLVAATGTGSVTDGVGVQLRVGYEQSSRDFTSRSVVDTGLDDGAILFAPGVQLGGDPGLPATVDRSAFSGLGSAHIRADDHHVKLGAGFQIANHERRHDWGSEGLYLFGSPAEFTDRRGVFRGASGSVATASFMVAEMFVFGQDTWRIAPGLDLTTGLRYEVEMLPADELPVDARWAELTGIEGTGLASTASNLGVVAGFDWDVQERHEWGVRGAITVQSGDIAPELIAEAMANDGRGAVLAAVGDVSAPITLGPRLTILSPDMAPPLTTRASFGISRALGATAAIHLDGVIRQTTSLPVRTDLNRPASARFEDQYGRPVFGRLARVGPLLHPEPGSNRRFGEFDAVEAVTSSAESSYWGISLGLEKRRGYLKATGSYTFSSTTDDWLGAGSYNPLDGLPPLAPGETLDAWAEGTSDFDVPHRLALATELTIPFLDAISLGGFWRVESGRPFTPGFGRAIDANADGVSGNDPAFVDESLPGMDEAQSAWSCLSGSAGELAERNSCRLPTRTLLDTWVTIRIPGLGAVAPELRFEVLGLDAEGGENRDTALLILDPDGELLLDEETGQVQVPLMVNPGFGSVTALTRESKRMRISFRMAF